MTLGEQLLELASEYQQASTDYTMWDSEGGDEPPGRAPATIAQDYENVLRELLGTPAPI